MAQAAPLQSHVHKDEGYALDWSLAATGRLASGDNKRVIHVWEPQEGVPLTAPLNTCASGSLLIAPPVTSTASRRNRATVVAAAV